MTLDDEPLEPLAVDDRSPGERMIAGGRAGLTELRGVAERLHFDTIALLWMLFTLLILGSQGYSALRFGNFGGGPSFGADAWNKASILAEVTSGFALASMIGIALASLVESSRARLAVWIAAGIGAWTIAASFVGVVVAWHGYFAPGFPGVGIENRAVGAVRYFGSAGLGMLVVVVAWQLARRRPPTPDLS